MTVEQREFASMVAERSQPGYIYPDVELVRLSTFSGKADIRTAGAYITMASLTNQQGHDVPVLYSNANVRLAKADASHGMTQKDGVSGQHGPGRWADWKALERPVSGRADRAVLQAILPRGTLDLRRSFEIGDTGLHISSQVTNAGRRTGRQRLGEHLYFPLPGGDLNNLQIVSHDAPLNDAKVREQIKASGWFWPGFDGHLIMQISDKKMCLDAVASLQDRSGEPIAVKPGMLGLMIWQRQGTQSICLEPLWGYSERGTNVADEGFDLAVGATATLHTRIGLLS